MNEKELIQKAKKGDVEAQVALGALYREGTEVKQDQKESLKWYEKAAKQGNAEAQFRVGRVQKTYTECAKWYHKAADQGHVPAMTWLRKLYYEGLGVSKDLVKAAAWSLKAAELGDTVSMDWIAWFYLYGTGVQKSNQNAIHWYKKALENENSSAMTKASAKCKLAFFIYKGEEGFKQDKALAKEYWQIASIDGNDGYKREAKEALTTLF